MERGKGGVRRGTSTEEQRNARREAKEGTDTIRPPSTMTVSGSTKRWETRASTHERNGSPDTKRIRERTPPDGTSQFGNLSNGFSRNHTRLCPLPSTASNAISKIHSNGHPNSTSTPQSRKDEENSDRDIPSVLPDRCNDPRYECVSSLIWHAMAMPRINLSIGLNTIHGISAKKANSKLKGETESMFVTAKGPNTRFEFVFTATATGGNTRLFTTVLSIHRSYETTKLYRELKMRGPILDDNEQLRILPHEQQIERINGVWNLSSDQGNLGVMITTNIRVVWFASMNPLYNVSISYLQLANARVRDSKFGMALVLDTSPQSGEYVLGFRIDPEEKLRATCKSIQSLQKAYHMKPQFGVSIKRMAMSPGKIRTQTDTVSDEELDLDKEPRNKRVDVFAAYFSDGIQNAEDRPPVFSEELGLAVEQLRPGFTINELWEVHVE